jgi:hypothetical protein
VVEVVLLVLPLVVEVAFQDLPLAVDALHVVHPDDLHEVRLLLVHLDVRLVPFLFLA